MPSFDKLNSNEKSKIINIAKYCSTHDFDYALKKISNMVLKNGNKIGTSSAKRFINRYKRCRNMD